MSVRSFKPKVYTVKQILQTKHHLSHPQAESSIVTVGNKLFGREEYNEWEPFNMNKVNH